MGSHSLLQGIFPTQIEPRFPALLADSKPSEPAGRPKTNESKTKKKSVSLVDQEVKFEFMYEITVEMEMHD